MEIKVLGPGCANCRTLAKRTEAAVSRLGVSATVTKVTDYEGMLKYGMLRSPGLVIEDVLVMSGRIPSEEEIAKMIASAIAK